MGTATSDKAKDKIRKLLNQALCDNAPRGLVRASINGALRMLEYVEFEIVDLDGLEEVDTDPHAFVGTGGWRIDGETHKAWLLIHTKVGFPPALCHCGFSAWFPKSACKLARDPRNPGFHFLKCPRWLWVKYDDVFGELHRSGGNC